MAVLAIGVIPLRQPTPVPGLLLLAFSYLPYLAINEGDILYAWSAYYWAATLGLTWSVLGWRASLKDLIEIGDGVHAGEVSQVASSQ